MPFLTIITVHLNDFEALFKTFRSLESKFRKDNFEWIVIDGGSETKSIDHRNNLELVKKFADFYVSEPDHGIYDAMNKGTRFANGRYILYLNAGDELHRDFEYDLLANTLNDLDACMLWGKACVQDHTGKIYPRKTRSPGWLRYGTAVCHQAVFFNRMVIGSKPYDIQFSIAGDYDLVCRLYKSGKKIELLDIPVCLFNLVGKSGTNKRLTLREESIIRQKYFALPGFVSGAISEFKYLVWQTGTFLPSFRRAWSRFF